MEIKISLPDEHAGEILAANAQAFKSKIRQLAVQRQQVPETISGTDQEIVEMMLKAQLISVTSAKRAQKAKSDFEKIFSDGNDNQW